MRQVNVYKLALIPMGNIKRSKNMSKENAHPKCTLTTKSAPERCAVISAAISPKVPLQKRKEQAKETLYLNRV